MTINCWVCKSEIREDDYRMRCVKCEMHMCRGCASDESRWCMNTSACIFAKKKEATVTTEIINTGKCAVCKSKILDNPVSCPTCDTAHCEGCWDGNCSVYGCGSSIQTPVIENQPIPAQKSIIQAVSLAIATVCFMIAAMIVMVDRIDNYELIKVQPENKDWWNHAKFLENESLREQQRFVEYLKAEIERERLARYHVAPGAIRSQSELESYNRPDNVPSPVSRKPNFARCHKYGGGPISPLCSFTFDTRCGK